MWLTNHHRKLKMSKYNALATSNIRRSYSIQWKSKNHCLYSDTHDKEQWIENSMAFDFTWYKRQRSGCLKSSSCCRNLSSFFDNGKHISWDKYPEFQWNMSISLTSYKPLNVLNNYKFKINMVSVSVPFSFLMYRV